MRARRLATLLLPLLIATAACDRTPVGPLDDAEIAALTRTDDDASGPLTLSSLLFTAIREVHDEHGVAAAASLVADLARIQHRLDGASVAERGALRKQLREEQLRIVLLVQGSDAVASTIRGVSEEADRLRHRRDALAASGIPAPEVSAMLESVPVLLASARSASSELAALDAATRAAAATNRMRSAVSGAARLPSLDDLFTTAAERLGSSGHHALIAESDALRAAAQDAVRSGERERARIATTSARQAQIRVVLTALGPDVVADVIGSGRDRTIEQQAKLHAAGRDVSRLERMNESAADMLRRADVRLRSGASAEALDLAGHAVDLLNAVESSLTSH